MKKILLAGYGNIAHAFEKIMKEQEPADSYTITICEIKNGNDVMEYLPQHYKEFDLVVNTSHVSSIDLSIKCAEWGIDYIDVGIESGVSRNDDIDIAESEYIKLFKELLAMPTPRSRMLMGFGINPGILEHIYMKYRPACPHYAFEMEHDDAIDPEGRLFHTFSPYSFIEESVFADGVALTRNDNGDPVIRVFDNVDSSKVPIRLRYHEEERKYVPVQHEELISMMMADKNMLGTLYLYQVNKNFQDYCLTQGRNISVATARSLPVLDFLEGIDHVGMAFWDLSDNVYWIKNSTTNLSTWKRYGVNAVSWQTATGLWIGYKLIDKLTCDHPHTMTELSPLYSDEIDRLLDQIGMPFDREDYVFDVDDMKRNLISIMGK